VQRRGIEIRAIWLDYRVNLRINSHTVEHFKILERPVDLPRQHRNEIDRLLGGIIETHREPIRPDDLSRFNSANWMRFDRLDQSA
jgi:hypothetical protein